MRCNYKQGFISLKKIKTAPFTKKKQKLLFKNFDKEMYQRERSKFLPK